MDAEILEARTLEDRREEADVQKYWLQF